MKNAEISALFDQMADIMEILGEDPFRINSYRKVARVIGDTPTDVEVLDANGQLAELPGIGKSSLAKIEEFIKTGSMTAHQELRAKIPAELLDLLNISGMGPKGVKAVWENLHISTIPQLKQAIQTGALAELHGFGEKKAAGIARGIEFLEKSTGRIRLDNAREAAAIVSAFLSKLPGIDRIQPAGSLRRCCETVGDVDVLVTTAKTKAKNEDTGEQIISSLTTAPFIEQVLASGPTKGSAIIQTQSCRVQVDVRVVPRESFGAAAQYFTGSKQHNVRLREIAVKSDLKLNEYGLFKGEKMVAGPVEEEIYRKLGLDYIDPRLREDRGEVEASQNHSLPELIQLKDIKGDFHAHTTASDGNCDLVTLVQAAKDLGYKFLCVTDHSQSSAIANGLTPKRLAEEIDQIHKLNAKLKGITILAGTEVDILADGSLDFDNKLLADLDFVVASVHSGLASAREKVTMRTLKAMDNPYVNCIGHPTGRLIGEREAMDLDIPAVIKHAAQTHTALEINANPYRLDLKDTHCKMAIESGVMLCLGTDTHSTANLALMEYGVATAARGWATKTNILNTLPLSKIKNWVMTKRPR